jgi:hypothetical protein
MRMEICLSQMTSLRPSKPGPTSSTFTKAEDRLLVLVISYREFEIKLRFFTGTRVIVMHIADTYSAIHLNGFCALHGDHTTDIFSKNTTMSCYSLASDRWSKPAKKLMSGLYQDQSSILYTPRPLCLPVSHFRPSCCTHRGLQEAKPGT